MEVIEDRVPFFRMFKLRGFEIFAPDIGRIYDNEEMSSILFRDSQLKNGSKLILREPTKQMDDSDEDADDDAEEGEDEMMEEGGEDEVDEMNEDVADDEDAEDEEDEAVEEDDADEEDGDHDKPEADDSDEKAEDSDPSEPKFEAQGASLGFGFQAPSQQNDQDLIKNLEGAEDGADAADEH